MEFLKTCSTNAQVIVRALRRPPAPPPADSTQGDFEAVAYQAVSVARNPQSAPPRDGTSDEDTRAVEAALRDRQLFVARDAARPWLWLFAPTTADQAGAPPPDLPAVDGYLIQREC